MKYFLFAFLFISSTVSAQTYISITDILSPNELTEVERAIKLYLKWDNDEEPKEAVRILENIHNKNPDNWVAPFWAAYISSQIGNSLKGEISYLESAQIHLDSSFKSLGEDGDNHILSNLKGLQALIYRLKSFRNEYASELDTLKTQELRVLNEAIILDSSNPALWVMTGTDIGTRYNTSKNLSDLMGAYALIKGAKDLFDASDPKSIAEIHLWNEVWVNPWLRRITPSSLKSNNL